MVNSFVSAKLIEGNPGKLAPVNGRAWVAGLRLKIATPQIVSFELKLWSTRAIPWSGAEVLTGLNENPLAEVFGSGTNVFIRFAEIELKSLVGSLPKFAVPGWKIWLAHGV